jgi:predicted TIM-barrel fold metal-dependent hydrolase
MMHRRELLHSTVALGAASLLASRSAVSGETSTPLQIVDTNVSLFHWPFRRLPLDETQKLVDKLRWLGVTEAWAGSFEGLLQRDIAAVNQRLVDVCDQHDELVAIGSINLELPGWQDDLRRCVDQHDMPGIRLHPNYHGYTLSDRRFERLLELASSSGRLIQIAAAMEDTRTQHAKIQVADVDLAPLASLVRGHDRAKVQILNSRPRGELLEKLAEVSGLYFDVARVEGTDGIRRLVRSVPAGRVLFGSHAPFLIPEAAMIRTHESDLAETELRSLLSGAARAVIS